MIDLKSPPLVQYSNWLHRCRSLDTFISVMYLAALDDDISYRMYSKLDRLRRKLMKQLGIHL